MRKRILAGLLALVMLVAVLPLPAVSAEASDPALTRHTHSDAHTCGDQCGGNVTWLPWEKSDTLPAESGHYYLTKNVTAAQKVNVEAGKDITICLNGYNIGITPKIQISFVFGKLTISDCTAHEKDGVYISGSVVGTTAGDGAVYGVRRGGTLVLESGRITGGTTTGSGGGGAVFLQKGTTDGPGGNMYMYGGEISGNEGYNGGAVCLGGADSGCVSSGFYMYGGKITGNHARNHGGAVYAVNRSVVLLCGGTIESNTVTKTAAAIYAEGQLTQVTASGTVVVDGLYFSNASNAGLKVNGLENGTQITMTSPATEISKLVSIANGGKQEAWNTHWITANDKSVSRVEGAFKLGHYHGTTMYEAWTGGDGRNTLPADGKNYYLANHIIRNTNGGAIGISAGMTQHLCLNGYTITHRNPANRLYNVKGSFFLEDCSAYTEDGTYISGGITYDAADSTMAYGSCFNLQRGGTMTMTGGQIYGFHSSLAAGQDCVPIYLQGANDTGRAIFILEGGEIHSNSAKSAGAAIKASISSTNPATENFSQIIIRGGKIWGNTSTTGGAVAATGDEIRLEGGMITGNTTVGGAVQILNKCQVYLSGDPTVTENIGGNLYLSGDTVIGLGVMTGGKVGISAAKSGRVISTMQQTDPSAFVACDNQELRLSYQNNCLYLGAAHEHGIDGKNGNLGWIKWTSTNSLPTESGNYYLEKDLVLSGSVTLKANVQLCLNGKTITAKAGKRIAAIGNGGTLTITDCCESCGTITGGTEAYGGAFNVMRGGTLKLYKGKITGNTSTAEGGAVYMQGGNDTEAGSAFYMYGGEISQNTAIRGGAVCLAASSKNEGAAGFYLYGGNICNNSANNGGAVYTYKNNTVLLSGSITDNSATAAGGGLYTDGAVGSVQLTGAPIVKNNKAGERNNNIHLLGAATMTVGELTQGTQLFVTAETIDRAITSDVTAEESTYFYSDSAYRVLTHRENKVYLEVSGEHAHCACFSLTSGCDHKEVKWQAWESSTTLPTATGYYYLLTDVRLQTLCTVPGDVHLCLNGKTVTAAKNNRLLMVKGILTVTDCGGTGKLTGGNTTFGGAVNVNRKGTFNLYGGTITGNTGPQTSENLGGAIYVQAGKGTEPGGICNLYGGVITENTAYQGGAVYLATSQEPAAPAAQLNIYGGEITGNHAGFESVNAEGKTLVKGGSGAAVYAGKYSAVTMQDGKITDNRGLSYGGTVYLNTAVAKFSGGLIAENTSGGDGGGLYAFSGSQVELSGSIRIADNTVTAGAGGGIGVASKSQLTMLGGTVTGNSASHGGGAIIQSGASMVMEGCTIENNSARANGGGIYVNQPNADGTVSSFYLKDGSITGNTSGSAAGGVYVYKGYMEMTGGTISKNETVHNGGAIYLYQLSSEDAAGCFYMTGGTITGNYSGNVAGGVFVSRSKLEMTGGTISDNKTKNYGCGIYYSNSTGKITGGEITRNLSGLDGAGMYVFGGAVEIGGSVKITNNTCQKGAGGGLGFSKESKSRITGGTITGNSAPHAGGIIVQGKAHLTMTGGYIGYNTTTGSGGGVYVNKSSMDFYGGTIAYNKSKGSGGGLYALEASTRFGGTDFLGNETTNNGGAMLLSKGTATFTGGTYRDNTTPKIGGGIYLHQAQTTMKNAKVIGNYGKNSSGGMHIFGGTIHMESCLFSENKTGSAGGSICATKFCQLTMKDCILEKNEANLGGGMVVQNWSEANLTDVIIRDNRAPSGAGMLIYTNTDVVMNGGEITGNVAEQTVSKSGKKSAGSGAGILMDTATRVKSGQCILSLNGVDISNNIAAVDGGGVYVNIQMKCYMDGCTVQNNQAGDEGAGIYQYTGSELSIKNSKLLANTAGNNGSAIYAGSDFTLESSTITGNKTQNGAAVYVAPARYDGHSYTNGTVKFGGDLQISDNEGTLDDLYMDEGTAAAVTREGFGENTRVCVQLHSGVLTNTILGKYDYEGGDLHYVLTYGDRSLTDLEHDAPAEEEAAPQPQQTAKETDTWLYAIIGVISTAAIVIVVLLILKKKKPAVGSQK